MCISSGPSKFSNTKGYIGRKPNSDNVIFAYQMDAEVVGEGQRAIILQIPAMKVVKIHDTTEYCNFLNDIANQTCNHIFSPDGVIKGKSMRKFEECGLELQKIGMYNVVVLENYQDFKDLSKVFPPEHCPSIQEDLIQFYSEYYSDWKFVVATFDNKKPMSAQPFMVEYESFITDEKGQEIFIFPALDNQTENGYHESVPKITLISEDHLLTFPHEKGLEINYTQKVPLDLISNKVGWYTRKNLTFNGDYIIFANGNTVSKMPFEIMGKQSIKKLNHEQTINQ